MCKFGMVELIFVDFLPSFMILDIIKSNFLSTIFYFTLK